MALTALPASMTTPYVTNTAVIDDPLSGQIIAEASDQTCLLPSSSEEGSSECPQAADMASSLTNANIPEKSEEPFSVKTSHCECNDSYVEVACLNPWGCLEQRPYNQDSTNCASNTSGHPLRHAALVATETVALRDMQLFPSLGSSVIQHNNRRQRC